MVLLIDAMALLWWLDDDRRLDPAAARSISDTSAGVLVSAATIWEIEVKRVAGRLQAPDDILGAFKASAIDGVPFTAEDAVAAARLPRHHNDPFDRMLVAQALRLDATIVSSDRHLDAYGVQRLPA